MKQATKILADILITILLINIALAQTKNWDYEADSSYKNSDFYKTSDPSKWVWERVDWSKVDFKKSEIYKIQAFYQHLPTDKYKFLDYRLVNYNLINHDRIDGNKYLRDLGCKFCVLDINPNLKQSGLLRFSSQGIRHQNGDYVSVPGTYHKSTLFEVTKAGITVKFTELEKRVEVPKIDSVQIVTLNKILKYGENEFIINAGTITIKNGEIFVKAEDTATINGVRIDPKLRDIKLFFDGKEHEDCTCTYISMDKDKKTFITATDQKSSHTIAFRGPNPFIRIQAPFQIIQDFGTIIIQNRENNDLIPSITIKHQPKGLVSSIITKLSGSKSFNTIRNGATEIHINGDSVIKQTIISNPSSELKSNPIVLSVEDLEGTTLIGTKNEPKRLVIDDNNRVSTINYREVSNYESNRLYFSLPEDIKVVAERAREASKRKEELKQEITQRVGVAPMVMLGWMDDSREAPIVRTLKSVSERSGLKPDFLTAAAFNEGLNEFIEYFFYENPKTEVSGFGFLGLDDFGSQVDELKRKGFLRKDFQEYRVIEPRNEKEAVKSANFKNVNYALEAFGAQLSQRRATFLNDARNLGYDIKSLSDDQINYWTYLYYNCGLGCGRERIKKNRIYIPEGSGNPGGKDPNYNSKRVLATTDLIKKAGLFEKGYSEKIALKK